MLVGGFITVVPTFFQVRCALALMFLVRSRNSHATHVEQFRWSGEERAQMNFFLHKVLPVTSSVFNHSLDYCLESFTM